MGQREVEIVRGVYASHEVRDTPGLVELLDHDHRQHNLVLIEAERCCWIGEKYTRVEDEGPSHSGMLLATGSQLHHPQRKLQGSNFRRRAMSDAFEE